MTNRELIHIYESAAHNKTHIFGIPGGALKPAEAAGELLQLYGHQTALEKASRKSGNSQAPWNFWYRVYSILSDSTP